MSLRLRLVLTFSVLLAITLISFGLVFYFMVRQSIEDEADLRLRVRSDQVLSTLLPDAGLLTPGDLEPEMIDLNRLTGLNARSIYVKILKPTGEVIASSQGLSGIAISPQSGALTDLDMGSAGRMRVLTSSIRSAKGQTIGIMQVGHSRAAIDESLAELRLRLFLLGGCAAVIAGACGWLVASRGLRPLSLMSSKAQDLADRKDFAGRLAINGSDEVGRLGSTIDGLLETIDQTLQLHQSFLVDTSHELRNPLFAVRTNLNLVDKMSSPESREECLREASEQVERMSRLVAELLLLARTEPTQIIDSRAVSLPLLLEKVVADGRKRAGGRRLELRIEDEATVLGDSERLEQIFINLLDNAMRYTGSNGTISLQLKASAGWSEVAVRDDGVGIGPEHLPNIFERFYRVDRRSSDGTGLGLAIVKHLSQLHGGTIAVESALGQGTCFTVRLPLLDLVAVPNVAMTAVS